MAESYGNTELQNEIITRLESDHSSVEEIASELGCSESYIYEVRNEYEAVIDPVSSAFEVTTSYAKPYELYAAESVLNTLNLSEGQTVKIVWEDDAPYSVGKIRLKEDFDWAPEFNSLLYALDDVSEKIPGEEREKFTNLDSEGVDISGPSGLSDHAEEVETNLLDFENSELIVGWGLAEFGDTQAESSDRVTRGPLLQTPENFLLQLLFDGVPEIKSIKDVDEEIGTPETVYFVTPFSEPSDQRKDIAAEEILRIEHFRRGSHYILPHGGNMIGPATTEGDSEIIQVSEDNIELISGSMRSITAESHEFEISNVHGIIQETHGDIDASNEGSIPAPPTNIHEETGVISFGLDIVNLLLFVEENQLTWYYPPEIELLDRYIGYITDNIINEMGVSPTFNEEEHSQWAKRVDTGPYVWDTNAIYHQIDDEEPRSILDSILSNPNFYRQKFTIPWSTLYEINKHKDSNSVAPRVCEQGIRNLNLLRSLDSLDAIELDVEDIPENLTGGMDASSVADMEMLRCAQSVDDDGVLVTSDGRLQEISAVSDVPVLDIRQFNQTEADSETQLNLWQQLEEVFTDGPVAHDELKNRAVDVLKNQNPNKPIADLSDRAENKIEDWVERGQILLCPTESEKRYSKYRREKVVPTYGVLQVIADSANDNNALTENFLEEMRSTLMLSMHERPLIEFCIPEPYVHKARRENLEVANELRALLQMTSLTNAEYSPVPCPNQENLRELAIEIAKEEDCTLLCEPSTELTRLSTLLDVTIRSCDP